MIKIFKYVGRFLSGYRGMISIFLVIGIIQSLLSMITPYLTGNFVDILNDYKNEEMLLNYCIFFVIVSILTIVFGLANIALMTFLSTKISYIIKRHILKHLHKLSLEFIEQMDTAYISQRVSADVSQLVNFFFSAIMNLLSHIIMFVVPFIMLITFNWTIGMMMLMLTIVYSLSYIVFKKPIYSLGYEYKESENVYFNKFFEQISMIRFVRIHGIGEKFSKRFEKAFEQVLRITIKYQGVSYLFSSLDSVFVTISQIFLFLWGGSLVINSRLSIGEFIIINTYYNMIIVSIRYFFGFGKYIQESLISYNRIKQLENEQVICRKKLYLANYISTIEIVNLSFSYGKDNIIAGLNAKFCSGKIYAILGKNGSGKSTLLNLLIGMHNGKYTGDILYNGKSIKEKDISYLLGSEIEYVEQDSCLFSDTIYENLMINTNTRSSLITILVERLGLKQYIDNLPKGLDTMINLENSNLSGGEMKKLTLIRSLAVASQVLLLDEPTTFLDEKSKKKLLNYLNEIKKEKIIILTTHDPSVLDYVDESLTINNCSPIVNNIN